MEWTSGEGRHNRVRTHSDRRHSPSSPESHRRRLTGRIIFIAGRVVIVTPGRSHHRRSRRRRSLSRRRHPQSVRERRHAPSTTSSAWTTRIRVQLPRYQAVLSVVAPGAASAPEPRTAPRHRAGGWAQVGFGYIRKVLDADGVLRKPEGRAGASRVTPLNARSRPLVNRTPRLVESLRSRYRGCCD